MQYQFTMGSYAAICPRINYSLWRAKGILDSLSNLCSLLIMKMVKAEEVTRRSEASYSRYWREQLIVSIDSCSFVKKFAVRLGARVAS